MAQAAVIDQPPNVYYCHSCLGEVQLNIPALTCSRCNSEFVEEMERQTPQAPRLPIDPRTSGPSIPIAELLTTIISELSRSRPPPRIHRHRYNTRLAAQSERQESEEDADDEMRGVAPSAVFHVSAGDPRQIMNYMIQQQGSNDGAVHPIIIRGNPSDFVWGPSGLDAIISQLLNHLEGSGAPPATRERIDSLPKVVISQSHIDNTLQCSICMDEFRLATQVCKLPCDHLYHSECITKWLEMHGTCPVCRKDLNRENISIEGADVTSSTFHQAMAGDGPSSPSPSSSSATPRGPSRSSSFTNFWRR